MSKVEQAQLSEEQKLAQFLALVEGNLDAIEDLPEYATFEEGAYNLRGAKAGINKEKGALNFTFEKLSLVDLGESADAELVPADGALLGANFYGKFGVQKAKQLFGKTIESLELEGFTQFIDQFENLNFVAVIGKREDKESKKIYNDIKAIQLMP